MLDSQLINGVLIDWDKIGTDSYLRNIDAISSISRISFKVYYRDTLAYPARLTGGRDLKL